jgi:hypothetical protein
MDGWMAGWIDKIVINKARNIYIDRDRKDR